MQSATRGQGGLHHWRIGGRGSHPPGGARSIPKHAAARLGAQDSAAQAGAGHMTARHVVARTAQGGGVAGCSMTCGGQGAISLAGRTSVQQEWVCGHPVAGHSQLPVMNNRWHRQMVSTWGREKQEASMMQGPHRGPAPLQGSGFWHWSLPLSSLLKSCCALEQHSSTSTGAPVRPALKC
jgi:hypothetical protein